MIVDHQKLEIEGQKFDMQVLKDDLIHYDEFRNRFLELMAELEKEIFEK